MINNIKTAGTIALVIIAVPVGIAAAPIVALIALPIFGVMALTNYAMMKLEPLENRKINECNLNKNLHILKHLAFLLIPLYGVFSNNGLSALIGGHFLS